MANLYTVMALQLALVGLRCLRVPQSCGVEGLRDGFTLSGRVCMPVSALDRIEGSSLAELRCLVVPWFCGVQGLRDGVTLGGRGCESAHALDRIVGFPEPLVPSSFALRSPLWVEPAYLCACSIVPKALTWPVLRFKFLRDGVTLLGSSVHTWVCTRLERRFFLGFV